MMFDADTIRFAQLAEEIAPRPDPATVEWIALRRAERLIGRMRRYCVKRGIPTANTTPIPYKGRHYINLGNHPKVRRKQNRTAALRRHFARRKEYLIKKQARDPRTRHWFKTEAA